MESWLICLEIDLISWRRKNQTIEKNKINQLVFPSFVYSEKNILLVFPWINAIHSVSQAWSDVPAIFSTLAINHWIVFPIKIKWEALRHADRMPEVNVYCMHRCIHGSCGRYKSAFDTRPNVCCCNWAVACFSVNAVLRRVTKDSILE